VRDRYFDADMKPALFKGLYHQMTQRYEGDRTAEIAYLDKEDGLVIGPTGFARLVRTSVAGGAPTWKAYNAEGGAAQIEVFIETVMPGGQADKAGLKSRDVIVSYNDVRIIHNLQLLEAIDSDGPMERRLVIDRGGRRIEVSVQRGRLGIVLKTRGI